MDEGKCINRLIKDEIKQENTLDNSPCELDYKTTKLCIKEEDKCALSETAKDMLINEKLADQYKYAGIAITNTTINNIVPKFGNLKQISKKNYSESHAPRLSYGTIINGQDLNLYLYI